MYAPSPLFSIFSSWPQCMLRLSKVTSYFIQHKGFSIGISLILIYICTYHANADKSADDVWPSQNLLSYKEALMSTGYKQCDEYIQQCKSGKLAAKVYIGRDVNGNGPHW